MNHSTTPDPRLYSMYVVRRLREAGHVALWAGGCVRDLLLGRTPKDYDVATSAKPDEVQRIFRRTIAVGESFGVVRVYGGPGCEIEVATFRSDGAYSDGRRPDSVVFSGPEEDALRRDFTINGMFYDPLTDKVFDYVGGREDLQRRVIRAIGDANQRFREDKLRLLRTVRFAAGLEFSIDPATRRAASEMADQIVVVSAERILMELRTMASSSTRATALELLREIGLFSHVLPEAAHIAEDPQRWSHVAEVSSVWKHSASLPLALAAVFSFAAGDPVACAATALERLRASNEDRDRVSWLIFHRDSLADARNTRMSVLKRLFSHAGIGELLDLSEALERRRTGETSSTDFCRSLLAAMTPEEIDPPPVLTGRDLIEAGLTPGPLFRELLHRVRDEQLDGAIVDKQGALELIQRWAKP